MMTRCVNSFTPVAHISSQGISSFESGSTLVQELIDRADDIMVKIAWLNKEMTKLTMVDMYSSPEPSVHAAGLRMFEAMKKNPEYGEEELSALAIKDMVQKKYVYGASTNHIDIDYEMSRFKSEMAVCDANTAALRCFIEYVKC